MNCLQMPDTSLYLSLDTLFIGIHQKLFTVMCKILLKRKDKRGNVPNHAHSSSWETKVLAEQLQQPCSCGP